MINLTLLLPLVIAAIIVSYFLPKIMLLSLKNGLLDKIDSRKIHSTAASRLGGASFLPAIIISSISCYVFFGEFGWFNLAGTISNNVLMVISSAMILYFVGLYDDIVGMRYKEKFFFQSLTAALVIYTGSYIHCLNGFLLIEDIPTILGVLLSLVLIVFITNAINLIDGIDGLASMLSMMAFGMYSLFFTLNGEYLSAIIALSALGALMPFFYHNVFGVRRRMASKIFMGDGGALVIGFLLSVMAIKLWNSSNLVGQRYDYISDYSWVIAFTMLIIPCFDVVRVVVHRFLDHKPLFLPDRSHFHHRLISLGLTPRRSLMVLFIFNLLFLMLNIILAVLHLPITVIIVMDIALWLTIHKTLSVKIDKA